MSPNFEPKSRKRTPGPLAAQRAGVQILDLLDQLRKERGLKILMVTHGEHVAERADRIVRMLDGRVVSSERRQQPVTMIEPPIVQTNANGK